MRNYKLDNIKGILIILVVLGHLLEININVPSCRFLYTFLYLFHMPLFAFTTGFYARPNIGSLVRNYLYPYLLFQILYLVFANEILGKQVQYQINTPYWILWYLFAGMVWILLLIPTKWIPAKFRIGYLALSIFIAIFVGFISQIDREYALSRVFVYFPFFLFGHLFRQWETSKEPKVDAYKIIKKASLVLAVILVVVFWANWKDFRLAGLYEANAYVIGNYTPVFRMYHLVCGFVAILLAMSYITNRSIVRLTYFGQNTMPIYLLHGFVVQWIGKVLWLKGILFPIMISVLIALLLVSALSARPLVKLLRPLFSWPFSKRR